MVYFYSVLLPTSIIVITIIFPKTKRRIHIKVLTALITWIEASTLEMPEISNKCQ